MDPTKMPVALVRYDETLNTLRKAGTCHGLEGGED